MESKKSLLKEQIGVCLLLSTTFFIFGPLEILISQSEQFFFSISDVILNFFILFLCSFSVLFLILGCASRLGKKGRYITILFVTLGVLFYIQGNWTFINYGNMDGSPINWKNFKLYALFNTTIWIVISIPGSIIAFHKQSKKIIFLLSYGIVILEIFTLFALLVAGNISKKWKPKYFFTRQGELNLSLNHDNLLVIIADGFDGSDFLPVLKEEPEFEKYFDGFTFFQDTAGTSLFSEEGGITILTGNQYDLIGTSFKKNIQKAYKNSQFYDELAKNNYQTSLYVSDAYMVSEDILPQISNVQKSKASIKNKKQLMLSINKMVMFRYMPHILKKYFWYTTQDFSEQKEGAFSNNNMILYEKLLSQGITASETEKNIYQLFWIQGPHEPAVMDRYCHPLQARIKMEDSDYSAKQFEQSIGTVRIFTEIIEQLKRSNIYDNTTIVFCSDHGWDIRPNPLLLVKPKKMHGDMMFSKSPISMIEDWRPTFLSFVNEKQNSNERTIFDIPENVPRERNVFVYTIDTDHARTYRTYSERESWIYDAGAFFENTPEPKKIVKSDSKPIEIKIGKSLSFKSLRGIGLSHTEKEFVWTDGKNVELIFKLKEKESCSSLLFSFEYFTFDGIQPVSIWANDFLIADYIANGVESKVLSIPGNLIKDDKLVIRFSLPNAHSPKSIGLSQDSRVLGLAIKGDLKFSSNSISKLDTSEKQITTDTSGFYLFEKEFVWQKPTSSLTLFNKKISKKGLALNLAIPSFVGEQNPELRIFVNGLLYKKMNTKPEELDIYFPPEEVSSFDDIYEIRIEHDFSFVPKELGINDDTRELSLQVSYIGEKR